MIETPGRILDRHLTEPLEQSNRITQRTAGWARATESAGPYIGDSRGGSATRGTPDRRGSFSGQDACARALNIPQPSLCLDVACEDVGVGPWSRDVLAMTRLSGSSSGPASGRRSA